MKRIVLITSLVSALFPQSVGLDLFGQEPPAVNAKCAFLRQELERAKSTPVTAPEGLPAGVRAAHATYAVEAAAGIIEGKIASCVKNDRLGSPGRLRSVESARVKQVEKVRQELQGAAADAVIDSLNRLYEDEAKSFFNFERVKFVVLDRDVLKDFPNLMDLLQKSSLDEGQRAAIVKNIRYIKYEEAGRLHNSLRGLDKDAGATLPYILRGELAGRADAEVKQMEKDEKTRAENVKKLQLQARITLSASMIVVVALIGFLLFRREVVTIEIYLTIVGSAFAIGLLWVLYTLGLWDWIQEFLNIAF